MDYKSMTVKAIKELKEYKDIPSEYKKSTLKKEELIDVILKLAKGGKPTTPTKTAASKETATKAASKSSKGTPGPKPKPKPVEKPISESVKGRIGGSDFVEGGVDITISKQLIEDISRGKICLIEAAEKEGEDMFGAWIIGDKFPLETYFHIGDMDAAEGDSNLIGIIESVESSKPSTDEIYEKVWRVSQATYAAEQTAEECSGYLELYPRSVKMILSAAPVVSVYAHVSHNPVFENNRYVSGVMDGFIIDYGLLYDADGILVPHRSKLYESSKGFPEDFQKLLTDSNKKRTVEKPKLSSKKGAKEEVVVPLAINDEEEGEEEEEGEGEQEEGEDEEDEEAQPVVLEKEREDEEEEEGEQEEGEDEEDQTF